MRMKSIWKRVCYPDRIRSAARFPSLQLSVCQIFLSKRHCLLFTENTCTLQFISQCFRIIFTVTFWVFVINLRLRMFSWGYRAQESQIHPSQCKRNELTFMYVLNYFVELRSVFSCLVKNELWLTCFAARGSSEDPPLYHCYPLWSGASSGKWSVWSLLTSELGHFHKET